MFTCFCMFVSMESVYFFIYLNTYMLYIYYIYTYLLYIYNKDPKFKKKSQKIT